MEAAQILRSSLNDIIFEGRNKTYGAYNLRETYSQNLVKAILLMITIAAILMLLVSGIRNEEVARVYTIPDIEKSPAGKAKVPEPPVKPKAAAAKPRQSVAAVTLNRKAVPLVVPDSHGDRIIAPAEIFPSADVIPDEGGSGDGTNGNSIGNAGPGTGTDSTVTGTSGTGNSIFEKVEVEASFPGGLKAWKSYLERRLHPNYQAPAGTYTVVVRFIVDTDGSISDVVAESAHGYGMEAEAVKAFRKGPKWTPALQNGKHVRAYRRQPITFVVTE